MKFKKSTILVLFLSLILMLPMPIQADNLKMDVEYLDEIIDFAQEHYVKNTSREQYVENAIKGVFENLDNYSKYYNPQEFEDMLKEVSGNFVGIGVYIMEKDGYILVIDTIKGSPAEKAGLFSGDIIFSVSGKSIYNMSTKEVVDLIKGEEGTTVRLKIKRGEKQIAFSLKRQNVEINSVEYEIIDNIGYIKLKQFSLNSYESIRKALDHMDKNNIENIILDLRDNPGGYLDQAIYIGNQFIERGPITNIKYKDKGLTTYNSYLEKQKYNLILLVNENSASASEVLGSAIKDRKSGIIIGTKTFGKGTVQEIISLKRGDGIKITVAEYFSPNMTKIEGIGVTPHILVKNKSGEDTQLKKAIERFTNP